MNIFRTIVKAAKAVARTVKELFGVTKAAYEAKVAKATHWRRPNGMPKRRSRIRSPSTARRWRTFSCRAQCSRS